MIPLFKKLPFLVAFPFIALSCTTASEDIVQPDVPEPESVPEVVIQEATTYIIKSGAHETNNPFRAVITNTIKFEVQFDASAIYTTKDPSNQADINKLYGMSDCNTFHHVNSARFGWRWYQGKLELLAYTYANGSNTSTLITAIDLNKPYVCELTLQDNKYVFKIGDKTVEHTRGCTGVGKGYQLYPYFGGDEVAPHEINIKIKEVK